MNNFSNEDLLGFEQQGIAVEKILEQLKQFKTGFKVVRLVRPAMIDDGILSLTDAEKSQFENHFLNFTGNVTKFVPASGAATRMFKQLFEFKDSYKKSDASYDELRSHKENAVYQFFKNLEKFAFYDDLKQAFLNHKRSSIEEAHLKRDYGVILETLLSQSGLGYGQLPKGLVKFHHYDRVRRTAAEEHLVEGLKICNENQSLLVHFTVASEYMDRFKEELKKYEDRVSITYSIQLPQTNTIAVDMANEPFRDNDGAFVFRPAGHGALLDNLNNLNEEIVFIKNVDNVTHESAEADSIQYKRILGGALLSYQEKIHNLLRRNEAGEAIVHEGIKLLADLGIQGDFEDKEVIRLLNRPIRVCGMVKNEGEPGGGPFWVADGSRESLQIIESAQVDKSSEHQHQIFAGSTHFNPVDVVCGLRDYQGRKFNLRKFANNELGFISEKSFGGRQIKAMELPGLWNGSMADWNTLFVEVPLSTFNPVKTINDLLKSNHQPS